MACMLRISVVHRYSRGVPKAVGLLLLALLAGTKCAFAGGTGPGFLTDVSELFQGFDFSLNGDMVPSVRFTENPDVLLLTCNDRFGLGIGEAYELDLRWRKRKLVVEVNPQLAGAIIYYRFPHLAAKVDDFRYIIDLEGVESALLRYGVSRNVFLYDTRRKSAPGRGWRALTRFTGTSGKGARTLKYFAEEGVVLVEVGKLSDSDVAHIMKGTEVPFCVTLDTARMRPLEGYPRIADWYRRYRAARSVISFDKQQDGAGWVYTFSKPGAPGTRSVHFVQPYYDILTRVFHLTGDFYVIGNVLMGTHIFDLEGLTDMKLGGYVPLGVDEERMRILLRSRRHDEHIEYRYWLLDLRAYFQALQERLGLDVVARDRGKAGVDNPER